MKAYDLALIVIRATIAVAIVREVAGLAANAIGVGVALLNLASGPPEITHSIGHTMTKTLMTETLLGSMLSIAISLAVWWTSPRLAHLVAKFSPSSDAIRAN